jgi:hypothetical protein
VEDQPAEGFSNLISNGSGTEKTVHRPKTTTGMVVFVHPAQRHGLMFQTLKRIKIGTSIAYVRSWLLPNGRVGTK